MNCAFLAPVPPGWHLYLVPDGVVSVPQMRYSSDGLKFEDCPEVFCDMDMMIDRHVCGSARCLVAEWVGRRVGASKERGTGPRWPPLAVHRRDFCTHTKCGSSTMSQQGNDACCIKRVAPFHVLPGRFALEAKPTELASLRVPYLKGVEVPCVLCVLLFPASRHGARSIDVFCACRQRASGS